MCVQSPDISFYVKYFVNRLNKNYKPTVSFLLAFLSSFVSLFHGEVMLSYSIYLPKIMY